MSMISRGHPLHIFQKMYKTTIVLVLEDIERQFEKPLLYFHDNAFCLGCPNCRMGHIAMCIDHEQYLSLSCDFYLFANRHTIWMWRCGIVGSGDVHLLDGLLQLCRQTCPGSHHARNIVHLNHSVPTPIIISLNWLMGFYPWHTEELFAGDF